MKKRRTRPGTKKKDLYKNWTKVYEQEKWVGLFHVQEYIQECLRDPDFPVEKMILQTGKEMVEDFVWIVANMRQIFIELSVLILRYKKKIPKDKFPSFVLNNQEFILPGRNRASVTPMDYFINTLDNAVHTLLNPDIFIARAPVKVEKAKEELVSNIKRVYRIFAWLYMNEEEGTIPKELLKFEKKYHTMERFLRFLVEFNLLPVEPGSDGNESAKFDTKGRIFEMEKGFFAKIGKKEYNKKISTLWIEFAIGLKGKKKDEEN